MKYLHCFKIPPTKQFTHYEEKKSNFIMEKLDDHHLNQVIKLTSPVMTQIEIMCVPSNKRKLEEQITPPVKFLLKKQNLSVIMNKTPDEPK